MAHRYPGRRAGATSGPNAPALEIPELRIREGERLGVVGPSGAGKSTLVELLLGLRAPSAGRVLYRGRPLDRLDAADLRRLRREVQLIPQDARGGLNPRSSALGQVAEPLRGLVGGLSRAQRRRRAEQLLEEVGLPRACWSRRPAALSGGQCQRVAVARALATGPRLLVADEPFSALDPDSREQLQRMWAAVLDRQGAGLLLISHEPAAIRALCREQVVLRAGRIVTREPVGPPAAGPLSAADASTADARPTAVAFPERPAADAAAAIPVPEHLRGAA
ncbi:MAG: dipeptide/oligopeptide/nickel ABC transporter ATP-binding protein [Actinomycetia bacterium]|nr:dipeptide/oligopeptide/nickel ABC transporter ATP-binding protein [Actinomycetes bacterium]